VPDVVCSEDGAEPELNIVGPDAWHEKRGTRCGKEGLCERAR
jgi:hypothetical protein